MGRSVVYGAAGAVHYLEFGVVDEWGDDEAVVLAIAVGANSIR